VIQCFSDLEGHRLDLLLKLLSGACGGPIYHPREFQEFRAHIQLGRTIGHIQGFRRVVPV
jgi:hypothetical protein